MVITTEIKVFVCLKVIIHEIDIILINTFLYWLVSSVSGEFWKYQKSNSSKIKLYEIWTYSLFIIIYLWGKNIFDKKYYRDHNNS